MFDLPMMIAVMICACIGLALDRRRRKKKAVQDLVNVLQAIKEKKEGEP